MTAQVVLLRDGGMMSEGRKEWRDKQRSVRLIHTCITMARLLSPTIIMIDATLSPANRLLLKAKGSLARDGVKADTHTHTGLQVDSSSLCRITWDSVNKQQPNSPPVSRSGMDFRETRASS